MKKLLLFVCCIAFVSAINCNEDEKYKLTININSVSGTGHKAYAILVDEGGDPVSDPAEYRGSADVVVGTATIVIDDIEDGTYEGGVFIDLDDSSLLSADPRPNSGDLVGGGTIDMNDDDEMTLDELDELTPMP